MTTTSQTIKPGGIWIPRDADGANSLVPRLLVLTGPEELPCGLEAVTVVPLADGSAHQLVDSDLVLWAPFVPVDLEPVLLQFSNFQSVLAGDLAELDGELTPAALPLLGAFWKGVLALADRPKAEDFPPTLAWDSGWPIPLDPATGLPSTRDVRNLRLVQTSLRMAPLARTLDMALHDKFFGLVERVPDDLRQSKQAKLIVLGQHLAEQADEARRAAGPEFLSPQEHLAEMEASRDPWLRAVHAVLSGDDQAIRQTIGGLPPVH
ncbi:MAG: hypothetical protein Q8O14_02145 [bacterium]|nr:hypothetical protein [bacterium]